MPVTLKDVAKLDFKIMPAAVEQKAQANKKYADDPNGAYKDSGPVVYSGNELKGAQAAFGPAGQPQINFQLKDANKFGQLTKNNLGKQLGTFLDKKFVQDATIQGIITDSGQIQLSIVIEIPQHGVVRRPHGNHAR